MRAQGAEWDALWQRSGVTHVTARAELVAQWVERFAPRQAFQAIVVRREGQFVAALPLISRAKRRVFSILDVPGNEWSAAGQLLIDAASDPSDTLPPLLTQLRTHDARMLWFASVPVRDPWWQSLRQAARAAGFQVDQRERYEVGRLALKSSWSDQKRDWSPNFRQKLRRAERALQQLGRLELRVEQSGAPQQVAGVFQEGLELENSGWKGRAGTALLQNPSALSLVKAQADQLAAWNQLMLVQLRLDDRLIAFEYGWLAKRVYHSFKVSYDENFARQSPGQVLVYRLLKYFHQLSTVDSIDFLGPLDSAVARWRPDTVPMGRLVLAPGKYLQRAIMMAAHQLRRMDTP